MDALKTQVGGNHYKSMAIQPTEFAMAHDFDPCAFSILKYTSRYMNKNGAQDIQKAIHFIDLRLTCPPRRLAAPFSVAEYCHLNRLGVNETRALEALSYWMIEGDDSYSVDVRDALIEIMNALNASAYQPPR